jgi:hypothetical protein
VAQSPSDPPTLSRSSRGSARPSFPSSAIAQATSDEQPPFFDSASDPDRGSRSDSVRQAGGRGTRRLALVGLAVVAVAGVAAFVVLGGGGGDSAAGPDGAVRSFFDAARERDCDRMLELVTEASWSQNGTIDKQVAIDQCAESVGSESFFPAQADITDTKVLDESGDGATVEVTTEMGDAEPVTETLTLVEEDGNWVIDFNAQASPADAPTDAPADAGATGATEQPED